MVSLGETAGAMVVPEVKAGAMVVPEVMVAMVVLEAMAGPKEAPVVPVAPAAVMGVPETMVVLEEALGVWGDPVPMEAKIA